MSTPRVGKSLYVLGRREKTQPGPGSKNELFDERMEDEFPTRSFGDGSFNEELKSYDRFKNGRQTHSIGTTS